MYLFLLSSHTPPPTHTHTQAATLRERDVIERQENEHRAQRRLAQERRNRWYNRLLNRQQDNPVSVCVEMCVLGEKECVCVCVCMEEGNVINS